MWLHVRNQKVSLHNFQPFAPKSSLWGLGPPPFDEGGLEGGLQAPLEGGLKGRTLEGGLEGQAEAGAAGGGSEGSKASRGA